MSDNVDPSGNTEQFRAFTNAPSEKTSSNTPLIVGVALALVVVLVVVLWIVL